MNRRHNRTIALGLLLALAQGCNSQSGPAPKASPSRAGEFPAIANSAPMKKPVVEQEAIDALKQMSDFLMTAKTMEINSQGSLDVVTNSGQRVQLDGTTNYKIRRPGFVIDYKSDIKNRRFIYDGKTFTVYSPDLGFYATVPAPPTNREVLDTIYDKFGISLPLEDLFRWDEGSREVRINAFQSAYNVGSATIDGVETEHYAFREPAVDWEIWIQTGDKPFPRKLVIVDRNDPAKPSFIARLSWKMNPTFPDSVFTFKPGANAKQIKLATYKGERV